MKKKYLALLNTTLAKAVIILIIGLGLQGCRSQKAVPAGFYSNYTYRKTSKYDDQRNSYEYIDAEELDLKTDGTFIYLQYRSYTSDDVYTVFPHAIWLSGRYRILKKAIILKQVDYKTEKQIADVLDKRSIMFGPWYYTKYELSRSPYADSLRLKIRHNKLRVGEMELMLNN